MKALKTLIILIFCVKLQAQEVFPIEGVKENFLPVYAFTNAKIIATAETEYQNGILIIQGNKIISVGEAMNITIPEGAIVYDLEGDYIYPSFIDLYTNYGLPEIKKGIYSYRPQYKRNTKGAFHWNQAIHPEIDACDNYNNNEENRKSFLDNGFGVVLTHQKDGIFRGTGACVALSQKSEYENLLLAKAASVFSFKKGVSQQKYPNSLMGSIALIRQTFLNAEWYEEQKNQNNLSYNAIIENKELPNIFILNDELDYSRVQKIADEFEIDFVLKGNGKEFLRINEIIDTESPIILPINFPKAYEVSNPETTEWITLSELKLWETAPYNPNILSKNNIEFCITSAELEDSKDFLKNIRIAVKKGLNKNDALASLTTTPAELIKIDHLCGTIEKDKYANFIICSNDIFEKGKIYENWVLGEQNIVNKKQKNDFRGYYTFNSDEFDNAKIIIKGEKSKPLIIFKELDTNKVNISISDNNINIFDDNGSFRGVGKINDNKILGRYQNKSGIYYEFTMVRDSILDSSEENKITEKDNHNSLAIPNIWQPNKAYGYEKLPTKENIIFKNATVWTNEEEGIVENYDVIISNGKIIATGFSLEAEKFFSNIEYKTVDASNLHLTSGIIDEHSHIAISRGVNEGSHAVTSEVCIGDVINPNDHNIYRQLAGGTTAAQLLHGSANPIGGQSAIIKFRWGESAENMKISDAPKFIKFALGENVKQSNWGDYERIRFPQTRMGVEQVFYDAFYRAKEYKKTWEEYNDLSRKEKLNTPPPREDLKLNALVEILTSDMFITCHSYVQSEINMLIHVADSIGFNVNTFTHILEGYKVAEKLQEHGAGGSTFSDWWAYKFEVNDAIPYNASLLNEAGVITAINSDNAEMGRRLNQEAAKAVKYGNTSQEDAWKLITLNPAKLLHLDHRMGSIKSGKDADIVLWTANPLSVYAKVAQTYVDGKLMFDIKEDKKKFKRDLGEKMRIVKLMSKEKNSKIKKLKPDKEKHYHCDTIYEHED